MSFSNGKMRKNINKIQTFQIISLREITNTPHYISNDTLHSDLKPSKTNNNK